MKTFVIYTAVDLSDAHGSHMMATVVIKLWGQKAIIKTIHLGIDSTTLGC